MTTVSAVIPTALREERLPYIRAALNSVLTQRTVDCEVIVVHNGSPASRAKLIGDYAARVRYVYEEVGDSGLARNRGVCEARGQFIAFLDDDDLWHQDKIALQSAAMVAHCDIDVIFTDLEVFGERGTIHTSYLRHVGAPDSADLESRSGDLYVQRRSLFEYFVEHLPFLPSCWMARRAVLMGAPFKAGGSEDRDLLWRLSRTRRVAYLDKILTRRREHDTNASVDWQRHLAMMLEAAGAAADWNLTAGERIAVQTWKAKRHFELGYALRKRGQHLRALRHQATSLVLNPSPLPLAEGLKNLVRAAGPARTDAVP